MKKYIWVVTYVELFYSVMVNNKPTIFSTYEAASKWFDKTKKNCLEDCLKHGYKIQYSDDYSFRIGLDNKCTMIDICLKFIEVDVPITLE